MNLWVDDVRTPPESWEWAKSSKEALALLKEHTYEIVSLDHDLGEKSLDELLALSDEEAQYAYNMIDTTRPIVLFWCEHENWPKEVRVHSSNPVGVEWLTGMINRYKP